MMAVTAEEVNVSVSASELTNQVKGSQRNERAAGQEWKRVADPAVDCHAAPHHQHSEQSGEQNVTRAGESGYGERFCFGPTLSAGRYNEREPVRWNHRVKKSNGKSRGQERYENNVVHVSAGPLFR